MPILLYYALLNTESTKKLQTIYLSWFVLYAATNEMIVEDEISYSRMYQSDMFIHEVFIW